MMIKIDPEFAVEMDGKEVLFHVLATQASFAMTLYTDHTCRIHVRDNPAKLVKWFVRDEKLYSWTRRDGFGTFTDSAQEAYKNYLVECILLS